MPKAKVQLSFSVEGCESLSASFEEDIEHVPDQDGMKYFIEEGVLVLRSELLYVKFHDKLPSDLTFRMIADYL